ncbi:MAG: 16S rRNA (uracil(1498)-N(3))-methyltransferase [Thiothrix nivea]|nr:MAG: 16S rRNA (uracil(1498)-N(3))-methyltransferase [Thiothrix nivea]
MRTPRFYYAGDLKTGNTLELPTELFRHAIQVLRMKTGEALILFNGTGGEFLAELKTVTKRQATVAVHTFDPVNRESALQLTLVQSIIKPDKMDLAIQKSVELGVTAIQPLLTRRSVIRLGRDQLDKKLGHWQAVAVSACEQSGRTALPDILSPLSLDDWLEKPVSTTAIRLMLMPGDYPRLAELAASLTQTEQISLIIGPEGGFSDNEVALCQQNDVMVASLGPRILRAETAAISVTALLQQHCGDL